MDSKEKRLILFAVLLALCDLTQAKGKDSEKVRGKWFSISLLNTTLID